MERRIGGAGRDGGDHLHSGLESVDGEHGHVLDHAGDGAGEHVFQEAGAVVGVVSTVGGGGGGGVHFGLRGGFWLGFIRVYGEEKERVFTGFGWEVV